MTCDCDFAPCGHDHPLTKEEEKEIRKIALAFMKNKNTTAHEIKGELKAGKEHLIKYDGEDFVVTNQ